MNVFRVLDQTRPSKNPSHRVLDQTRPSKNPSQILSSCCLGSQCKGVIFYKQCCIYKTLITICTDRLILYLKTLLLYKHMFFRLNTFILYHEILLRLRLNVSLTRCLVAEFTSRTAQDWRLASPAPAHWEELLTLPLAASMPWTGMRPSGPRSTSTAR